MARNIEMALNFHKSNDIQLHKLMNNPAFSDNPVPKNLSQCHHVNILSWNICGITDKLRNRQLCEYICQHDIVCLVESMLD